MMCGISIEGVAIVCTVTRKIRDKGFVVVINVFVPHSWILEYVVCGERGTASFLSIIVILSFIIISVLVIY